MAKNYLPPLTFGRYGQQIGGKATGLNEPKNYYDEKMGYDEMLLRGAGVRHFNEAKEVQAKANALKNTKKHELEKAKEKNDVGVATKANENYDLGIAKVKDAAMGVNLDLRKY